MSAEQALRRIRDEARAAESGRRLREAIDRDEAEPLWGHDLGMLGHKIATEAVVRLTVGIAQGTPSMYNIIRESAIDILEREGVKRSYEA